MKIEFVDLKRQNQLYLRDYQRIIEKIILNADFIQGDALTLFEEQFARFCKKKYCIGLNSGTDALLLALLAYEIGNGDEVIVPPNSYFSTAMVVEHTGAKVVFADIDPKTYTLDPKKVAQKITSRTKAIIPVHLYGQAADLVPIVQLANKHRLQIIEDACQAHGACYKDTVIPYTETGAFSFYPGKNLGGFGDGGALVTDNKKVAQKVRLLRNDGSLIKYQHQLFGYKSRLDTLQASILSEKLTHLNYWNRARKKHATSYTRLLLNNPFVKTPYVADYAFHVFHIYAIEAKSRNALQKFLFDRGIATVIHYPTPIHLQSPYRQKGYKRGDFPVSEEKATQILSLPMFPELTEEEITYIIQSISDFYKTA